MWAIEGSLNANMRHPLTNKQKEALFTELLLECKHSAPGARFTAKLRTSLERLLLPARKELCGRVKDGCAPLFISCKRGNLEIVEYLITVCGVDIEQRGLYEVPDDRSVHYVTPLWCASVSGKLEVIRCLVRHGADINAGSDSGSTPVRSACFMTHLDIVRFLVENGADICQANYNGGTCLINSVQSAKLCTFLLENGAQVNATDMQNKTALHYAIQEHRRPNPLMTLYGGEAPKLDNVVETTKLLLDNGADPYAVSRSGDDALQTACLKGATQIFSLLTGRIHYSQERMADAHELIGSTLLDDFNDIMYAMQHWRIANRIRNSTPHYIAKRPHMPPRVAYRQAVEFTSEAELDVISTDIDAMRIQSLLICERVLGIAHKDTVFRLMYRGASYADALRYQRCIDLWMWALSIRIERDSILYTDTCYSAQAIVKIMIDLKVGRLDLTADDFIDTRYLPRFCDVVNTFNMLTETLKETRTILDIRPVYKKQSEMFDRTLKCITHLIFLLLATATTPETRLKTKELVTNLVAMNVRSSYTGDTLLHLSVSRLNVIKSTYFAEDMDVRPIFPDWGVAKLLLDCGSNVNAKNESKSTPLHVASIPYNFSNKLIHLLLEYDAHVDQPNKFGDSPAYLIQTNPLNDVLLLKHVNLKCLAANVVVANHIPYDNGQIPMTLVPFVRFHEP